VAAEPRSRYGNRSPYKVLGRSYSVRDSAEGYVEQGMASYYGNKFHGRRTSNLEVYDMYAFTAAHKSLPLPSFARVTNLENGRSVVVRVNDRGPFHDGRVIDLSYAAAVKLGYRDKGTARVEVRGLAPGDGSPGNTAREPYDAVAQADRPSVEPSGTGTLPLPPGVRIATGKPARPDDRPSGKADSAMDKLVGLLPVAAANAGERPPQVASASPPPGREWRFDMRQDGKAMTADEFDAWMRSRRARVATGKPGLPSPDAVATSQPAQAARATPAADGDRVTLQVASFANPQNADHALAMLRDARIDGVRLSDAQVNGQRVYRLRVGPVDADGAAELAARVVGLGFGAPQRVRD
jgi:rare lipoprotein A